MVRPPPRSAGEAIGVRCEVGGQGLDGDLPVESGVGSEIHHAHAAAAEFTLDLEWTNGGWVHEGGSVRVRRVTVPSQNLPRPASGVGRVPTL